MIRLCVSLFPFELLNQLTELRENTCECYVIGAAPSPFQNRAI